MKGFMVAQLLTLSARQAAANYVYNQSQQQPQKPFNTKKTHSIHRKLITVKQRDAAMSKWLHLHHSVNVLGTQATQQGTLMFTVGI